MKCNVPSRPSEHNLAFRFHFDSLAHDNSATDTRVENIELIPNDRGDRTPAVIVLSGAQLIQKFNRTSVDEVYILMAIYRVEEKNTDVVVTFNIPVVAEDGGGVGAQGVNHARQQFEQFSRSLKIVNFELFA